MSVLSTETDSGVATMTVEFADDLHKFDVWTEGGEALVEYQETLTWRGQIRASDPDEEVYKELMQSEEMTDFLNRHGAKSVRQANAQP